MTEKRLEYARLKRGLLNQDRDSSVFRPLLFLQATTAGYELAKFKKIAIN